MLDGTNILVTGGCGFIGSHLVEALVEAGAEVTVVDNLSEGNHRNLSAINDAISFEHVDITNRKRMTDIIAGQQLIFHLAANAHVPTSVDNPEYDFEVNARGTQIILDEARKANVGRVVLASSAAVYGPPKRTPIDESHPLDPISPYGASKLTGEKLGMTYFESYNIEVTALRIFNTFGPRQPRYVMFDFLRKLEQNQSVLEVLGTGEELRTFAFVSDTVEALVTLGLSKQSPGEVYNFGGETPIQIRELAELMAERYYEGNPEITTTNESKAGDIPRLIPDNSAIEKLGISPDVSLTTGLDELYEWYQ